MLKNDLYYFFEHRLYAYSLFIELITSFKANSHV